MDPVLQLANIARPTVPARGAKSFRRESQACLAALRGKAVEKFCRHDSDVVSALTQRRQTDDDDGQAKVEVLAELPIGDGMLQIGICCGDNSDVRSEFPVCHPRA